MAVWKFTTSMEGPPPRYVDGDRCVPAPGRLQPAAPQRRLVLPASVSPPELNPLERWGPHPGRQRGYGLRGILRPSSPHLVHGVTVTHRQEQAEGTPGICPPSRHSAPRVKEPLREKPVMVSTSIPRALGQKQDIAQSLTSSAAGLRGRQRLN